MKNIFASVGILAVAALVVACSGNPQLPYTVTGEFHVAEAEEVADYVQAAIDAGQLEVDEPIDISETTVSLIQKVKNDAGEMVDEVLASGSFENDKIEFEGTIESPTKVSISIDVGTDSPLELDAVIAPGQNVAFKLVDQLTPATPDQLLLSGEYRIYTDASDTFVITGDVSELDEDLTFAEVQVFGTTWDDEIQDSTRFTLGPVNPKDGKFVIEGTASNPMVVSLYLRRGFDLYKNVEVIAEAGIEADVSVDGSDLVVSAPEGSHHYEIIESWTKNADYLAKVSAYEEAFDAYQQEMEAQRAAAEASQDESAVPADEVAVDANESEEPSESESVAVADEPEETQAASKITTANAEGCEHVDTSTFEPLDLWSYEPPSDADAPEYVKLANEVTAYRTAELQKIANNLDAPLSALLAVEAGAFSSQEERLAALEKLATSSLNAELITSRVAPARDRIVAQMEAETNDKSLVPGQIAPAFTLASLDGEEVSLYETLASNDYVLVDFWASWCGPCIASFPKLKKLHAAFNNDGFEIISVSIDATFDEWEEKSRSLELPWIDLGEVEGEEFQGPTPVAYGVGWIPKGYLLDTKGCILNKDMEGEKLQELLVAEYGDRPELQEEVEEEESAPEASEIEVDEA